MFVWSIGELSFNYRTVIIKANFIAQVVNSTPIIGKSTRKSLQTDGEVVNQKVDNLLGCRRQQTQSSVTNEQIANFQKIYEINLPIVGCLGHK